MAVPDVSTWGLGCKCPPSPPPPPPTKQPLGNWARKTHVQPNQLMCNFRAEVPFSLSSFFPSGELGKEDSRSAQPANVQFPSRSSFFLVLIFFPPRNLPSKVKGASNTFRRSSLFSASSLKLYDCLQCPPQSSELDPVLFILKAAWGRDGKRNNLANPFLSSF